MTRVLFACVVCSCACGSRSELDADASTCDQRASPTCEPLDGGPPTWASPATGTITGDGLDVTFCPDGVYASVKVSSTQAAPYEFGLGLNGASATPMYFDSPPRGAQPAALAISVPIPSNAPGDYAADPKLGASFTDFFYQLVPACFSCGDTKPKNVSDCPPGCSTVCSSGGCEPCAPDPPGHEYAGGAWTLTLTADPIATGTDAGLFTPHGSFTATLSGADGGAVTVSATF